MRVTSALFVSALTRRLFNDGSNALIEKKGAEEAGAIFIRVCHRDRSQSLLAPAPQSFLDGNNATSGRSFEMRLSKVPELDIDAKLARERTFDNDIWIVEIETDHPENYLDLVSLDGA